jgi:hypothetical protein
VTLAGDLITVADEDIHFSNNINTDSATNNYSERRQFVSIVEVTAKVMRALMDVSTKEIQKWFQKL